MFRALFYSTHIICNNLHTSHAGLSHPVRPCSTTSCPKIPVQPSAHPTGGPGFTNLPRCHDPEPTWSQLPKGNEGEWWRGRLMGWNRRRGKGAGCCSLEVLEDRLPHYHAAAMATGNPNWSWARGGKWRGGEENGKTRLKERDRDRSGGTWRM